MSKGLLVGIAVILIGGLLYARNLWISPRPCDPRASAAQLATMADQGILGVRHPPSQSNLLWIFVGHTWHILSEEKQRSIDHVVRCAAQTTDDHNRPNWQAAYYDQATGRLAALTSRKWGFRLKGQESHFAQDFPSP